MAKYTVSYAVRGYYDIEVEADSREEAENKAKEVLWDGNFGDLIDPTSEFIDAYEN